MILQGARCSVGSTAHRRSESVPSHKRREGRNTDRNVQRGDRETRSLTKNQTPQLRGTAVPIKSGAPLEVCHITPEMNNETFAGVTSVYI